jgi:hypothetical protein
MESSTENVEKPVENPPEFTLLPRRKAAFSRLNSALCKGAKCLFVSHLNESIELREVDRKGTVKSFPQKGGVKFL